MEKASKELIKELLDNLLDDKILTSGEVEAIIEEYPSTADKTRKLIDTVKKKGDRASNTLISYLHKRDGTLYEELCKASGVPAKLAVQETLEQHKTQEQHKSLDEHDGLSLIKCTKNFWAEKQNPDEVYPVTPISKMHRVALIITNIQFANLKYRNGADADEENMENLLSALGYAVVKYRDLNAVQMDEALAKFSKHPNLKETDSVFVVIMSHGILGAVCGVNYNSHRSPDEKPDELPVDNIYRHLNAKNCPALVDKPKVIIIQACRGEKDGSVKVSDGMETDDAEEDIEADAWRWTHKEKDFIALLSCTPHTVSGRHRVQGSLLIQFVVKVFNKYSHQEGIEDLFRRVMKEFENRPGLFKQMANKDRCSLPRLFFLFPGL